MAWPWVAAAFGAKFLGGWLKRRSAKKHAKMMQQMFERERLRNSVDQYRSVGYDVPMGASRESLNQIVNSQGARTWLPGYGAPYERKLFQDIQGAQGEAGALGEEYRPQQEQATEFTNSQVGPQQIQNIRDWEGGVQNAMTSSVEGEIKAKEDALGGTLDALNQGSSNQMFQTMAQRYGGQNVGGAGFYNAMQGNRQNLFGQASGMRGQQAVEAAQMRGGLGEEKASRTQNLEQNVIPNNQLGAYGNIFADKDYRQGDMFSSFKHAAPLLNYFAPGKTPVQEEKIFNKPYMGSSAGNIISSLGDMGMQASGFGGFMQGMGKGGFQAGKAAGKNLWE